jgi:hypothetical protein
VKLAIIHFSPLELYPPIQNLLPQLKGKANLTTVTIITTSNSNSALHTIESNDPKINIVRLPTVQRVSALIRYWRYVKFHSTALWLVIIHRPDSILYFETISSFPAYIYRRFINPKVKIYIHYHEYTSPLEYKQGMKLALYFHRFEKWLYPNASWVSHTNTDRMEKFKQDIEPVQVKNPHIMPNFPPRSWYTPPKQRIDFPLKVVYAGALSMNTMYTKAFACWVAAQNGEVVWDIFSYNCTHDARMFIEQLKCGWISLKPGVDYYRLPSILKHYDAGVILYNGHIPNYIYNAPNKLFEYLACGLAVLFPEIMIGSLPFLNVESYPEVMPLDFNNLKNFEPQKAFDRTNRTLRKTAFFAEEALQPLLDKLIP